MFKKMMASVGVGSAKVDTILDNPNVQALAPVTGHVYIKGGKVEQKIDDIYLEVRTHYKKEVDDSTVTKTATIQKITIPANSVIQPKQEVRIPFQFNLAPQTPLTMGRTKTWIHTGLDIKQAIDPTDKDFLNVHPHPAIKVIMDSLAAMGFQVKQVENEFSRFGDGVPFVQEIEYRPTQSFRGQLDELEVVYFLLQDGVGLMLEVDRKSRGLKGFFQELTGADESNVNIKFTNQELQTRFSIHKQIDFIN